VAENLEIEVKFLEIDVPALQQKLAAAGAEDLGEDLLTEIIFYDKDLVWVKERHERTRFVRLRRTRGTTFLTYKSRMAADEYAEELETKVEDIDKATALLEAIGLVAARHQEKKRHSYVLDGVAVDIDTWPQIPSYVELEGSSEDAIKAMAAKLGFDWGNAVFGTAPAVIEDHYGLAVQNLKYFTFDKVE
jgi:adenylate cyclase, class 2